MRNKVPLYKCEKCGYLKLQKKTIGYRTSRFIKKLFIVFIGITSIFGTLALYNFWAGNFAEDPNLMVSLGGTYAFTQNYILKHFQSSDYFVNISNDISKGCQDDECKSKKIYDYIEKNFKYVLGTRQDPIVIWNSKYGDCDELSILYENMLKSIGIKSRMNCNEDHCWSLVFLKNKTIHADITMHNWRDL